MVSIEFGGGPNIEQRRKFAAASDGGHIAGYQGFCPQLKYTYGKTFSQQTAEVAKKLPYYNGPNPFPIAEIKCEAQKGQTLSPPFRDELPLRMIPKARGDNKYIENLMPGYSGDLPGYNFMFGGTYTNIANQCIDTFVYNYIKKDEELKKIHENSKILNSLMPTKCDSKVREELNLWIDDVQKNTCRSTKKTSLESGIPGYTGFVPRYLVTDASLGYGYTKAADRCLKVFDEEVRSHFENLKSEALPPAQNTAIKSDQVIPRGEKIEDWKACTNKVGCIPKYTGYVPQFKYQIGHNYGDTTRKLSYCSKHVEE